MDLREYQKLIDAEKSATRELARAEGALARDLKELNEGCNCPDQKAATKLLTKLDKEAKELEVEADRLAAAFGEKWGDKLEGEQ